MPDCTLNTLLLILTHFLTQMFLNFVVAGLVMVHFAFQIIVFSTCLEFIV